MVGQWTVSIAKGRVAGPEAGAVVGRGRVEMIFHWGAEFLTAVALLVGGTGVLARWNWAANLYLLALGMLLYTAVNSAGYFAQKREWPMVGVFGVIFAVGLVSLAYVV
jgi:hypothetical protein